MSLLIKLYDKMSIVNIFKWFGILLPVFNILALFSSDYRAEIQGISGVLSWIMAEIVFLFISFCLIYFVVGKNLNVLLAKSHFH